MFPSDLQSLQPKVKYLSFINLVEGIAAFMKVQREPSMHIGSQIRYLVFVYNIFISLFVRLLTHAHSKFMQAESFAMRSTVQCFITMCLVDICRRTCRQTYMNDLGKCRRTDYTVIHVFDLKSFSVTPPPVPSMPTNTQTEISASVPCDTSKPPPMSINTVNVEPLGSYFGQTTESNQRLSTVVNYVNTSTTLPSKEEASSYDTTMHPTVPDSTELHSSYSSSTLTNTNTTNDAYLQPTQTTLGTTSYFFAAEQPTSPQKYDAQPPKSPIGEIQTSIPAIFSSYLLTAVPSEVNNNANEFETKKPDSVVPKVKRFRWNSAPENLQLPAHIDPEQHVYYCVVLDVFVNYISGLSGLLFLISKVLTLLKKQRPS